jgi:hypothetical protein
LTDGDCGCVDRQGNKACLCPDDNFTQYKNAFKERGIHIIGIGVSDKVNATQIKLILDNGSYHPSVDFDQLTEKSFVHNLSVCDGMYIKISFR